MLALCENCGRRLRSEVVASGAFRFVAHFDDEEGSPTHAEHTPYCPGCGVRLDRGMSRAEAGAYSPTVGE